MNLGRIEPDELGGIWPKEDFIQRPPIHRQDIILEAVVLCRRPGEEVKAGAQHDGQRHFEERLLIERPIVVVIEHPHAAVAGHNQLVILQYGMNERRHFLVIGVKTMRANIKAIFSILEAAGQSPHAALFFQHGNRDAGARQLIGDGQAGHSSSNDDGSPHISHLSPPLKSQLFADKYPQPAIDGHLCFSLMPAGQDIGHMAQQVQRVASETCPEEIQVQP